jgi:hypothetical protein
VVARLRAKPGGDAIPVTIGGIATTRVDGRLECFSVPLRYVWPAELDLMAALAGLRLRDRWTDWKGEPFTAESDRHVSVWEKAVT